MSDASAKNYPSAVILDFASMQRNLAPQEGGATAEDMLAYHFTDDRQQTPAFVFQRVNEENGEEDRFRLVYLDPSLEWLWKDVNRGR
jgi:hypothetical protein